MVSVVHDETRLRKREREGEKKERIFVRSFHLVFVLPSITFNLQYFYMVFFFYLLKIAAKHRNSLEICDYYPREFQCKPTAPLRTKMSQVSAF